jgi:hypothetical protein
MVLRFTKNLNNLTTSPSPPVDGRKEKIVPAYLKVRGALKQCKGSLSEDILLVREDRI